MKNLNLEFLNEKLEFVKDEVKDLIEKNGEKMYEGIFDYINELVNDEEWWSERYNEILSDDDFDDDEDYRMMVLEDDFDRELIRRYGKKFYDNLISLGYNYDEDGWDIKDDKGMELSSYGVIWELWYDLDTDVREAVSDIWEESFI